MPVPTIDGELYSEAGFVWQLPTEKYPLGRWVAPAGAKEPGIAAVGAPAYCEHPTTEILTVSYDLCDRRGIRRWRPGQALPWDLMNHLQDPDAPIEAHNAMFERLWVEKIAGPKHGWVVPDWRKWRCSMATAIVAQRPGALANLADVLGVSEQKDKEGKRLIKKFCIPQQPILGLVDKKTGVVKRPDQPARRIFPHDDPVDFEKLCEYCDQDVRAEMAVMAYLPPLSAAELRAWQATQEMNYRGLGVDRAGLRACIDVLGKVLDRYGQECVDITGFAITQLEKLKGWLGAYGVHSASLDSDHIDALLERTDLPPIARRVLELRALTGSASVKKTLAIENRCSSDNRLRDIIVHHGTRPGRPTGEGPQPLNLPKAGPKLAWCECGHPAKLQPQCPWCGNVMQASARKVWESGMVDHVVEIMGVGSLDLVERFFGDAMLAIQGCVRGLFEAAPGYQLVSTDYSSLQAVVAACLAGEQWRIDAFKRGDPIYLLGASKITGKPLQFYLDWFQEHGDHHPDRQYIGKVSELACMGPLTQVLTMRGYVAIADVLATDLLWDGVEWVEHQGVIFKGHRDVFRLDGVLITPDHLVNMNGSWQAASTLGSDESFLCRALATGSANLPLSVSTPPRGNTRSWFGANAGRFLSQPAGADFAKGCAFRALRVRRSDNHSTPNSIGGTKVSCPTWATADVFLTEFRHALRVVGRVIRRKGLLITARAESGFSNRGRTERKENGLFSRILSACRVGTTRPWKSTEFEPTGIMSPEILGSSRVLKTSPTSDQSETCKPCWTFTSPVFDIAHAGPRNRFTIKTDSGHIIVHNCGFQGWINSYRAFGSVETDEVIRAQILAWRDASPAIVEMWGGQWRGPPWRRQKAERYGLEGKFIEAVQSPCETFSYRGIDFTYDPDADCIEMLLPACNGHRRPLRYHEPRLSPSARSSDELSISYMTWNTNPNYGARGWVRMPTWGGRLFENAVMGVEVDIQRFGQELLAAHGYPMVLGVYDEDVCEIPIGHPLTLGLAPVDGLDPYVQEVEHLLAIMPPEYQGWPIKASGGWRGRRYRKG